MPSSEILLPLLRCFTEVGSKIVPDSLLLPRSSAEKSTYEYKKTDRGQSQPLDGEIRVRVFRKGDTQRVRELFTDSYFLGENALLPRLMHDAWFGHISLGIYSTTTVPLLLKSYLGFFQSLGIAGIIMGGAFLLFTYRLVIYRFFVKHAKNPIKNGDLADIMKTFEVEESMVVEEENKLPGRNGFWVAECHGENGEREIVGCGGLNANTPGANYSETTSEFRRMVVSPQYRRRGIAQKIIHQVIEHARRNGVEEIYLSTTSYQTPAFNMYRKLGWKVKTHRRPTILFSKLQVYEMVLDVQSYVL